MPVRERAALAVLAGEPDGNAFGQQAREGESFRVPPVDPLVQRGAAPFQLAPELVERGEVRRPAVDCVVQLPEPGLAEARRPRLLGRVREPRHIR